jgi:cytochrome c oxidase subunit 3
MWLFLSTEILFFSGLFCAYAVYRHNHPDIFIYAHQFLDKRLGGINTLVLIFSSFTAAWAVRAAQLNQRLLLIGLIVATLLCSFAFLGIKGIEYEAKWKHGLLWGQRFSPGKGHLGIELPGEADLPAPAVQPAVAVSSSVAASPAMTAPSSVAVSPSVAVGLGATTGATATITTTTATSPAPSATVTASPSGDALSVRTNLKPAGTPPAGLADDEGSAHPHRPGAGHGPTERPQNAQIFFGIYFAMTGLHGIHVIAGIIAWLWVLRRAIRGDFSSAYYTPVDLTALYWHLVDLVWIYLFPLLYLIH